VLRLSLLLAWLVALLGVVAPRVAWGAVDQRAYAGVADVQAHPGGYTSWHDTNLKSDWEIGDPGSKPPKVTDPPEIQQTEQATPLEVFGAMSVGREAMRLAPGPLAAAPYVENLVASAAHGLVRQVRHDFRGFGAATYIGADGGVKVYSGVRDKTDAVPWLAQVVIIPLTGGGAAGSAAAAEAGAGGGAGAPRVLYHYTNAAERSFGRGLWSGSSVTDTASLGATEAVEQLGLKTVPDKIIPIIDRGHFIPNRPFVVQAHPLGPGGGLDFWNPRLVPPLDILPAIPIARP